MNRGVPFSSELGLNAKEQQEGLTLIGWGWGAPGSVRSVIGRRVWLDMETRTVRRIDSATVPVRARNLKTVYSAGIFDLLHRGHLNILERSKELAGPGGQLIVGVVTDRGAEAYKRRPVQDEHTRAEVIRALRCVDAVVMQDGTDPSENLTLYRPDIMSHGSDWTRLREGHQTLERLGIEWEIIPYTIGVSTTETIERMRA